MTVSELIAQLQELPADMEVGGWRYHFLPMHKRCPVSVETTEMDVDQPDGSTVSTEVQVAVLSFRI